ncbi:MAG: glycosyltransferase [Verrucomicrobia bacterium]|nr:glycosyltransferase [Verrucomicrobiota bacterium]
MTKEPLGNHLSDTRQSMRLLWGPLPTYAKLRGPHEIVEFGRRGVSYKDGETWDDLFARLPSGFEPDAVVWRFADTNAWPAHTPCPKPLIAILSDWSLFYTALRGILDACDWIITDRLGTDRLKAIGITHVQYWPGYAFDPGLCKRLIDIPPDYDVTFIGNLNHDIHRIRARILAKIARLSDRYRVAIRTNIHGRDYANFLARSRIVVNHSVRREMNLRGYEAPACGALLFMEESNLEVSDFLRPGEECVLYREDNLEDLLVSCLENEPLRARMAEAGWTRIQAETFRSHMAALLDLLKNLDLPGLCRRPKRWPALDEAERHYRYGKWLAFAGTQVVLGHQELTRAIQLDASNPEYWNAAAVVEAVTASKAANQDEQVRLFTSLAENRWLHLLKHWPGYVLGWVNLGLARLEFGFRERGVEALTKALEWLAGDSEGLILREGCLFYVESDPRNPTDFSMTRVEWERLAASCGADEARLAQELRAFLRWQCARRLGDVRLASDEPQKAKDCYAQAIHARPDLEHAYTGLGKCLELLGQNALACAAYRESLERQPWNFDVRVWLAGLLNQIGDSRGADQLASESLLLAKALGE